MGRMWDEHGHRKCSKDCVIKFDLLGAVHILRQPPEGGEGVWQMLTIADEEGRGGKPKAGHC